MANVSGGRKCGAVEDDLGMLRSDFTRDGWRNEEVREALELCLDL